MRHTTAVFAAAILASALTSPSAAQDEPIQSGPGRAGETVAYRLALQTAGIKDGGQAQTTLTLTRTPQGMRVSSSSPPQEASAAVGDDGFTGIGGTLRAVLEPYDQLQAALRGRDGHGRSTVDVLVAGQEVSVPVAVTATDSGNTRLLAFAGQTNTRVKGVGAHVAVDMKATVVRGRLESASARNDFDASIPLRTIHVAQVWSLTRLP